jgi:hypothetical protein
VLWSHTQAIWSTWGKKRVALSQKSDGSTASCTSTNQVSGSLKWKESEKLWDADIDQIDLLPYCADVIEDPALRETLNKPVMGKLVLIKEEALL